MRQGRNRALKEFGLADEMPFCPQEDEAEFLTAALAPCTVRKVDNELYKEKKRRLNSKAPNDVLEIDAMMIKALNRLLFAVEDCITLDTRVKLNQAKAAQRNVLKTVRESKSKQLFKQKVLDETQQRTRARRNAIQREVQQKIDETAAAAVASRKEELRERRRPKRKGIYDDVERDFLRISQLQKETEDDIYHRRMVRKKAQVERKRRDRNESIKESLRTLREGMDQLDSAASAMLNRRVLY